MMNETLANSLNDFDFIRIKQALQSDSEAAFDLVMNQELIMAITHLISIEEHFVFTGAKTSKPAYYDLINELVPLKKKILHDLLKGKNQRLTKFSNQLLATLMRLMEVGTKQLGMQRTKEAADLFSKAYKCYLLFLAFYDKEQHKFIANQLDSIFIEELNAYIKQFTALVGEIPKISHAAADNSLNIKKIPIKNLNQFIEEVDALKKQNKLDLSSDQDLTLAIMNLVVLEDDFFFAGVSENNHAYYELLREIRELRKQLLEKLIQSYEGEVWCISKHLLSASMRLINVGRHLLQSRQEPKAYEYFQMAYDLYALFWGLNLGIMDKAELKRSKFKFGLIKKMGKLVKKAIDCCIE